MAWWATDAEPHDCASSLGHATARRGELPNQQQSVTTGSQTVDIRGVANRSVQQMRPSRALAAHAHCQALRGQGKLHAYLPCGMPVNVGDEFAHQEQHFICVRVQPPFEQLVSDVLARVVSGISGC